MLRKFDDPALRLPCKPVERGEDLSFLDQMRQVCEQARGIGLAAPQIGVLRQAILIWPFRARRYVMLNPRIADASKELVDSQEGCLSYPGVSATVPRHTWVMVEWLDKSFAPQKTIARDLEARVIQHEVDHLQGICRVGDEWKRQSDLLDYLVRR